MNHVLQALSSALDYNASWTDAPLEKTCAAHPATGECATCKQTKGQGRKRCPEPECGHFTVGCNALSCKYCGHRFVRRAKEGPPKKRRKTATTDVGVQCDIRELE